MLALLKYLNSKSKVMNLNVCKTFTCFGKKKIYIFF